MRDYLLYCAGPITGTSYNESTNWRDYVACKLPPHIIAVSPMRGKTYLAGETTIKDSYATPLSCPKGITTRDRLDTMRADMLFVNFLGAQSVSIGTTMEIAWADMLRIPILIVMEENNIHRHAMITEVAGFIVPNLNDAIRIAISVLTPGT